jgi:hypothetical protein
VLDSTLEVYDGAVEQAIMRRTAETLEVTLPGDTPLPRIHGSALCAFGWEQGMGTHPQGQRRASVHRLRAGAPEAVGFQTDGPLRRRTAASESMRLPRSKPTR